MAIDSVTVSETGNKEGITASILWSFKVRPGIVVQETETGQMCVVCLSGAVIPSL